MQRVKDSNPSIERRRRRLLVPAVASVFLFGSFMGVSDARSQTEDQIKAAFLFNFARYVEWPESAFSKPGDAVRICIVGSTEFAGVVSLTVSGKSVKDRPVSIEMPKALSGVSGCHILYVGEDVQAGAREIATSLGGESVFTVSDREGFAATGGIANFIRADNKVRFEINPTAARKAGLKVSSSLLRLAKVVE